MWRQFTYTKSFLLQNAVDGVASTVSFRANSLYDPEVAVGGAQPRYFTSVLGANDGTAPYRNYRVHASRAVVELWPTQSNANASNCIVSLIPRRPVITEPDDIDEMRNRPYSRTRALTTTAAQTPRKLINSIKIKTLLGHKDLMDVDATAAIYNTNPSEPVYWDLSIVNVQGGSVATVFASVTIVYYAQLYTLNDVQD